MEELQLVDSRHELIYGTTWRDMVAAVFQRKKLIIGTFLVVFGAALALTVLIPLKYESDAKIYVTHEREDPVISTDAKDQIVTKNDVTDEDVASEIELITSYDLQKEVVLRCGLDKLPPSIFRQVINLFSKDTDEQRVARAVNNMNSNLVVQQITGSDLIAIQYRSANPKQSEQVVRTMTELYLQKHLAVHRPTGVFDFFDKETARYKEQLTAAQKQLADFTLDEKTVSATTERDAALQKAIEMEASLRTTQAEIRQTQDRIRSVKAQIGTVPARMITSDRNGDTGLLAQLQGNLVGLQLRRTEMLTKYQPTYPAVRELEQQIEQTKQAIAADQRTPIREITTDKNPTAQLLSDDLAKSNADLAALKAKEAATQRIVQRYREEASRYFDTSITQQNLQREAKLAEDQYLLYSSKREEARIGDALDSRKMVNVAIAEPATLPVLPVISLPLLMVAGFLLASVAGLSAGIAGHFIDASLHSPKDVERYLDIPVLAALPERKA